MFSHQPPSPPPSNDGEVKPTFRDLPRSYQYPYTQNQQQQQQGAIYAQPGKEAPLSYGLLEVDESEMAEQMVCILPQNLLSVVFYHRLTMKKGRLQIQEHL